MRRKLFAILVALFAIVPAFAEGYDITFQVGDLWYGVWADTPDEAYVIRIIYDGRTEYDAYETYKNLTTVKIPATVTHNNKQYQVTTIAGEVFSGCTKLKSVTIPDGIRTIGSYAFDSCVSLTSIVIPRSVEYIEGEMFAYCHSLVSVTVDKNNKTYDSRNNCNAIIETATNTLVCGCNTTIIPSSITSIEWKAFSGCTGLTSITIPNSVTMIGGSAFRDCSGLTIVNIPNSVTGIESYTFSGCTNLASVVLGEGITHIENQAFENCVHLTSVTIPRNVKDINAWAFDGCTGLSSIVWNPVTHKSQYYTSPKLFETIAPQITSFTIGNEVDSIPASLCEGMNKLSTIVIPDNVKSVGMGAFVDCTELVSVYMGKGIDEIDGYTFSGCSSLTTIAIPSNVKSIGSGAFSGCTKLKDISMGKGIAEIADYAFSGCSSLTSIIIPDNVAKIGYSAFENCSNLTTINWNTTKYTDNHAWSSPFSEAASQITSVTFGEEVDTIPDYFCYNMEKLTTLVIPNSVKWIGEYAFYGCAGITNLTLSSDLTRVGNDAFHGCTGVTSVVIPDSVWGIGNGAFYGCSNLQSIRIPNTVSYIGDNAFYGCSSLTSVNLPSAMARVENGTFADCISLTSITLPDSITSIGDGAFGGCTHLASVTIMGDVTAIGWGAFSNCAGLKEVTCHAETPPSYKWNAFDGVTTSNIPLYVPAKSLEAYKGWDFIIRAIADKHYIAGTIGGGDWTPDQFEFDGDSCVFKDQTGRLEFKVTIGSWDASYGYNELADKGSTPEIISGESRNVAINLGTAHADVVVRYDNFIHVNIHYLSGAGVGTEFVVDNIRYRIGNNGAVYVIGYEGNPTTLTLPPTATYNNCTYTVTQIIFEAFKDCTTLTSVVIPNSVTNIGESAFSGCAKLSSVTIGSKVWGIGANAFAGCRKLYDIYVYATEPPIADNTSFANYNVYLYVPCDNLRDYQLDAVFGSFKNIECFDTDPTDVTEVATDNETHDPFAEKVFRNGQVLILRNGKTYALTGVEVE